MMKMKGAPQEQIDQDVGMFEKDPELFKKIAAEAQVKMKEGKDQMTAMMEVSQKYQKELKDLM